MTTGTPVEKAKRLKFVAGRYIGDRDYWEDVEGTRYYHRSGGGVAYDPYKYQWDCPAVCYEATLRRLSKINLLELELTIEQGGDLVIVRSKEDARQSSLLFATSREVRRVNVWFRSLGYRPFHAVALHKSKEVARCGFATEAELESFIEAIEGEFLRQTLSAPAKSGAEL